MKNRIKDNNSLFLRIETSNRFERITGLIPVLNQANMPHLYIVKQKGRLQQLILYKTIYAFSLINMNCKIEQ